MYSSLMVNHNMGGLYSALGGFKVIIFVLIQEKKNKNKGSKRCLKYSLVLV